MTTRNGLAIDKRHMPAYGKTWAFITTKEEGSPFSFEDWFYMIRAIVECELDKYGEGDPDQWDRWAAMPKAFMSRCFDHDATWTQVRDEFRIPDRSG